MKNNLPNINHETIVFTKHARERMNLRKLSEDMVIQILRKPNKTYETDDGKIKFIGKSMGAKVHAICKPIPEENKWLVISLWVRGEDDAGNFVNQRARSRKAKDRYSLNYIFLLFLLIIVAIIYYFSQVG